MLASDVRGRIAIFAAVSDIRSHWLLIVCCAITSDVTMFWSMRVAADTTRLVVTELPLTITTASVELECDEEGQPIPLKKKDKIDVELYIQKPEEELLLCNLTKEELTADVELLIEEEDRFCFRVKGDRAVCIVGHADERKPEEEEAEGEETEEGSGESGGEASQIKDELEPTTSSAVPTKK